MNEVVVQDIGAVRTKKVELQGVCQTAIAPERHCRYKYLSLRRIAPFFSCNGLAYPLPTLLERDLNFLRLK